MNQVIFYNNIVSVIRPIHIGDHGTEMFVIWLPAHIFLFRSYHILPKIISCFIWKCDVQL